MLEKNLYVDQKNNIEYIVKDGADHYYKTYTHGGLV